MDARTSDGEGASAGVRVKQEPASSSDEMKEFAETAMNELLGWYGYEAATAASAPDDEEEGTSEARRRARSAGDSSGPEYSDSGGVGRGGPWCGWCSRPMAEGAQATGAFCSELCFAQSRRASFKRTRACDWCRHVRHTVAHAGVHEGARHLQFCGDKCLNQYKMHIFCRETRAHLELHPHPAAALGGGGEQAAALITPDLWLKDCRADTPPPEAPPAAASPPAPRVRRRPRPGRAARTATATAPPLPPQPPAPDGPEDLRVRARSPVEPPAPPARAWPPAPPPVTVLVPYPVVVPVPVPLPLPIPIPVPEETFRRFTTAATTAPATPTTTSPTTIVTTSATSTATTAAAAEARCSPAPTSRSLRSRKRPAPAPGDTGGGGGGTRRTVPA